MCVCVCLCCSSEGPCDWGATAELPQISQSLSITSTVTADSADTEDREDIHTRASKLTAEISHKLQKERAYVAQLKQELASCKEAEGAAGSADISNKDTLTFRSIQDDAELVSHLTGYLTLLSLKLS